MQTTSSDRNPQDANRSSPSEETQTGGKTASTSVRRFAKLHLGILERRDIGAVGKLVYAVIVDRIGNHEFAWPGIRTIAKQIGVDSKTVLRAVAKLELVGLLIVEKGTQGRSNRYRLPTVSETVAFPNRQRSQNANSGVPETPTEALPKRLHNQIQSEPLNQTYSNAFSSRKVSKVKPDDAERIYAAYPRKVGKYAALSAIKKALSRLSTKPPDDLGAESDVAEWLLDRVKRFAASPAGQAGRFTPYPSTWFNQERYFDDQNEWKCNAERSQERSAARVDAPIGKYVDV